MASGNGTWATRSYNAIKADPECENLRKVFNKQAGLKTGAELAVLAGTENATVNRILSGETRWPRHSTIAKIYAGMGHSYKAVPTTEVDYAHEIPIARQERKEYRAEMKKKKARSEKRRGYA